MEIATHRVVTRGIDKPYVEIPEGVTHIGKDAFLNYHNIQHVKFPSTLLELYTGAFTGCENLLSVDFSECRDLMSLGSATFEECFALRHVNLSNCPKIRRFEEGIFEECVHLTLFIPRTVQYFQDITCGRVQIVAISQMRDENQNPIDAVLHSEYVLTPKDMKSELNRLFHRSVGTVFYVDDYDAYADVFDAIGQLNVIWIESLRRQSRIRNTKVWNKVIIVEESETRNRVTDLWNRVKPYNVFNGSKTLFEAAGQDILSQGRRLVTMRSYQRQPEETKLFKEILDSYDIKEPPRPQRSDGRSAKRARRLMANLRL